MDAMTNYPQQRKLDMRAELEARDGHLVVPDEPLSECRVSGWGGDGKSLQTVSVRSVAVRKLEVTTIMGTRSRSTVHTMASMVAGDAVPTDPEFPLVVTITREVHEVRVAGSGSVPFTVYRAGRRWMATGEVLDVSVELSVADLEPSEISLDLIEMKAIPDSWWE